MRKRMKHPEINAEFIPKILSGEKKYEYIFVDENFAIDSEYLYKINNQTFILKHKRTFFGNEEGFYVAITKFKPDQKTFLYMIENNGNNVDLVVSGKNLLVYEGENKEMKEIKTEE